MRRLITLFLTLFLCVSSTDSATVGAGRQTNQQPVGNTMIALTAFDVNDKTLELHYKVVNRSNHDVWVCSSIYWPNKTLPVDYAVYMDEDARTLVIRRQIEVPGGADRVPKDYRGRYVLLHAGEEWVASFSLSIPVVRYAMLGVPGPDVDFATRVVLKIGFYNEDLPGKIRSLLDLATRLGYSSAQSSAFSTADWVLYERYFPGFSIARTFGGLPGFSQLWTEGSPQIDVPYTEAVPLGDESTLQVAVDGVVIPVVPVIKAH
jgi:hypothetical protein